MESTLDPAAFAKGTEHLYATRYLTLAGAVVLLWDTLLTLPEEIRLIWKTRLTKAKYVYLVNRYGICTIVLYYLTVLIPYHDLSTAWCRNSNTVVMSIDTLLETLSCGVVIYRLYLLWECDRVVLWLVATGFVVLKSLVVVFVALSVNELNSSIFYISGGNYRACITTSNPRIIIGVWVPAALFDIYAFSLFLINALSRPRSESQRLLDILYRDGLFFFLTTCSMRIMNLVISLTAPPTLTVLGTIFSSTMATTAVSRSILGLYSATEEANSSSHFAKIRASDYMDGTTSGFDDSLEGEIELERVGKVKGR